MESSRIELVDAAPFPALLDPLHPPDLHRGSIWG